MSDDVARLAPELERVDLGPMSLGAPPDGGRRTTGSHGRMWQWIGDGAPLLSLSAAYRTTRVGDATGVAHHLTWELDRAIARLGGDTEPVVERDVLVPVLGTPVHRAGRITGEVHGLVVRHTVVFASDGDLMHVVQLAVDDSDAGRETERAVLGSIEVHPGRGR